MGRLQDKTVMITGAARGLGAACARLCAREGARVALTDVDIQGAQAVAEEIETTGASARAYQQDVTDEAGWEAVVAAVTNDLAGLDVLVNNAGIGIIGSVEDTTLAQWRQTMAVNLDSVFLGTRAAIGWMKGHRGGSIVNISSIEGIIGEP
ncbi:MAG: SDR family NAD(P)-dependent oxidoreductase, partial [Salinisphaera sp.]|nr:SDR family NAD(P)-dependent oxidoreductase [Salinisphaera sp.]